MDVDTFTKWSGWAFGAVMFAINVYTFVRDRRPNLRVISTFTGSTDVGHGITFLNNSKIPANVFYLELVWTRHRPIYRRLRPFRQVVSTPFSVEAELLDLTVPAFGQASMNFNEQDYFAVKHPLEHDLYAKVWLLGYRLPKWFLLAGPD